MKRTNSFGAEDLSLRDVNSPLMEGLYRGTNGQCVLDRCYTTAAIKASGILNPRTADLNIIGLSRVIVPDAKVVKLGLAVPNEQLRYNEKQR